MEAKYINALRELNAHEADLAPQEANEIILKHIAQKVFAPATARNLIRYFVPFVMKQFKKTDKITSMLETVLNYVNNIYPKLYKKEKTKDDYYSQDVRNIISKEFGKDSPEHILSKKLLKISFEEKAVLNKASLKKVVDKNLNRVEFTKEQIISVIADNIGDEDPIRRSIALLTASGCRPIELFAQANFTKIDDNWITQDFLAKKKGEEVSVIKPIIYLSSDRFIKEVTRMRKDLKEDLRTKTFLDAKNQLKSTISTRANAATKIVFDFQDDITLYACRKLYALLSYSLYGTKKNIYGNNVNYQLWISKTLGHGGDNQTTSFNYSHFALKEDRSVAEDIVSKQAILDNKIEIIEDRLETLNIQERPRDSEVLTKSAIRDAGFKKIKVIYDRYVRNHKNQSPTQTQMEKLCANTVSRAMVRLYFKHAR